MPLTLSAFDCNGFMAAPPLLLSICTASSRNDDIQSWGGEGKEIGGG